MKCLIGTDKITLQLLEDFIGKTPALSLAGIFGDPAGLMNQLSASHDIDLVIIDIDIYKTDLIDLEGLHGTKPGFIAISTGYGNAFKANNLPLVDYLLKPVCFDAFSRTIDKVQKYYTNNRFNSKIEDELYVKKGSQLLRLKLNDIHFIEAIENSVVLHTSDNQFTIHFTLKALENRLPLSTFVRIHKSYIVNRNKIRTINKDVLELIIGDKITNLPLEESFREQL